MIYIVITDKLMTDICFFLFYFIIIIFFFRSCYFEMDERLVWMLSLRQNKKIIIEINNKYLRVLFVRYFLSFSAHFTREVHHITNSQQLQRV